MQAQQAPALLYAKVVGRPGLEATQHHRPTQPLTGRLCDKYHNLMSCLISPSSTDFMLSVNNSVFKMKILVGYRHW